MMFCYHGSVKMRRIWMWFGYGLIGWLRGKGQLGRTSVRPCVATGGLLQAPGRRGAAARSAGTWRIGQARRSALRPRLSSRCCGGASRGGRASGSGAIAAAAGGKRRSASAGGPPPTLLPLLLPPLPLTATAAGSGACQPPAAPASSRCRGGGGGHDSGSGGCGCGRAARRAAPPMAGTSACRWRRRRPQRSF